MATSDMNNHDVKCVLIQIYGEVPNRRFPLDRSVVLVGSCQSAYIEVNGINVSRKHCILMKQNEGWMIQDCSSRGGTYLNGQLLQKYAFVPLRFGDLIFLGSPTDYPTGFSFEADETKPTLFEMQPPDEEDILISHAVEQSIISEPQNTAVLPDNQVDCIRTCTFNEDKGWVLSASHEIHNVASSSRNCDCNKEKKSVRNSKPKNTSNEEVKDLKSKLAALSKEVEMLKKSKSDLPKEKAAASGKNKLLDQQLTEEEAKDLKLKLAALSKEVEMLKKSKSDLLKEKAAASGKNKLLDQQLTEQKKVIEAASEKNRLLDQQLTEQNKVIDDILMNEQTMKTKFKDEIVGHLEEDLVCNICAEILIKPTVLDCSHTFCEYCIKQWEREKKQCPVCRKNIQSETRVLALDNYIDKTLEALTPEQKKARQRIILEREQKRIPNSAPPEKRRRTGNAPSHPIPASVNNMRVHQMLPLPPYRSNMAPAFPVNNNIPFQEPWNYPTFSGFF